LQQLTKRVLESALDGEITDHVGYDKHDPAGRGSGKPATAPAADSPAGACTDLRRSDHGRSPVGRAVRGAHASPGEPVDHHSATVRREVQMEHRFHMFTGTVRRRYRHREQRSPGTANRAADRFCDRPRRPPVPSPWRRRRCRAAGCHPGAVGCVIRPNLFASELVRARAASNCRVAGPRGVEPALNSRKR
jgi:hypothetical protein